MASLIRRRRGTPTVGIQVDVTPDVKDLIDTYMRTTGMPQWAIIEAAIRAAKPGPHGYPDDWDLPGRREELPIPAA